VDRSDRWRLASFDLDGTLVRGTSVSRHLADRFGHFDERNKVEFVAAYCKANDIDLAECIAVGDSRSDILLFEAVGFSIALNATPQAREAASVALDTEDLIDVLDLIPWG
jgi:phosphoserine phosphatase